MSFEEVEADVAQEAPEYEEPRLIDLGSLDDVTRGHRKHKVKDNFFFRGSRP